MVELTANVDGVASQMFQAALTDYAKTMGEASASAPRRAAITLCKSFKAATKVAKQNKGLETAPSEMAPKWITYRNGQKLDQPLRRMGVTLTDRGLHFARYVYGSDRATQKRSVRNLVGKNYFQPGGGSPSKTGGTRGLAKRSWGWVMHNIFNGAAPDAPWSRRKNDRRNPKDAAKDSMSRESKGNISSSGCARICNRLDYIGSALKTPVDTIVRKGASALVNIVATKTLRNQGGMSSAQIRAAAKQVADALKREFPN